nr:hypothetical protein [Tanacetum cinerariifolium]
VNSPSFSGRIVPLFDIMLVHQGEGSGTPTEPHHTPSHEADTSHPTTSSIPLLSLPTAPIPPISLHLLKGEACPTKSGFITDQDRATIAKSFTLPHDSAPMALEVEIIRLKERVQVLEDRESVATKQSRYDALIKGKSINEGEAAAERVSDDSEELARVLTSMDAARVLAGGIDVPTGSGSIPTAGPPAADISTCSERLQEQIDAQVARELEEQQEKEDMRMNEQIARDAEEELQGMIDSLDRTNDTIAKYMQEDQDFTLELPLEKRIELISDLVKYQENYSKKQKTSEEAPKIEKSTEEIPEEKMNEMMQLVPVEEVHVQALQVKHPIIDWKSGSYTIYVEYIK